MDHGLWPTQGSTQGAYLFNCYASTLSKIIPDSLTLSSFADDHSIRRTFKPETTNTNIGNGSPSEDNTIAIMERSMHDIKTRMEAIKLNLNEAKTEFIYFRSRQQLNKAAHTTIYAIGESSKGATKVRYLGGHLDSNLQRLHTYQMQSYNTEHHQDMQHKEIPNKRNMPQTNSATGHITPRLCKLNASRTAIIRYKNNAKNPNTVARLIFRKMLWKSP